MMFCCKFQSEGPFHQKYALHSFNYAPYILGKNDSSPEIFAENP